MSYQHPNSSTVIFEYEQNENQKQQQSGTTKSNSNKICNSNTNTKDDQNSPIQITTNIIKVKSTPRIRTRGKIHISGGQIIEQPVKKKIKRLVFEEDDDDDQDGKEDKGSQSLSNRETKNTKTIEQHDIEEYDVQKNVSNLNESQDFQIQLYARQKSDMKRQQKIQPQSVIPCKAKRQLGNSDEDKDEEEQIKEKEQEYESQQQQEYEEYIRKQKQAKMLTKIQRQPSLSINFTSEQLQTFLHTPINPKYQFQCVVEINEGFFGIGNRYHLKQKFQNKILISAKKELMSFNPKIILSMNKDNHSRRHRDFIGMLEGNFGGTQWKLQCPVVPNRFNEGQVCEDMRDLLIARYDTSVMGSKSLRQMRAYIIDPSLPKNKQKQIQIEPQINKKSPKISCLQTAKPSLIKGRYMLDFKGLAKIPSNKNFIMLTKQGVQCLIFAKQSEEMYVMNIRYPLTLVQGFSLCLASLNSKLFVN